MIKGENLIEKEQAGVGDVQFVFGQRGQPLDLAHRIIGEVADGAGGEWGQPFQARGFVAAKRVAKNGKDVALKVRGLAALGDGDLAPAGHDAFERREADEGVATHLLAALNRFEQKAFVLRPGRAQKAETGVSRSAIRVRHTGTRVCVRARSRNSLRLGWAERS